MQGGHQVGDQEGHTLNPAERPFLTAEWRHLVLLQYGIDPTVLAPLVPRGTQLDLWQNRALVSVVGFRFLRVRVLGVSVPFHTEFDEVNLRFYVRRRVTDGWRRGVVFVREIVPRRVVALVARVCYGEPYLALPMRHLVEMPDASPASGGRVRYEWRRGERWESIEAEIKGAAVATPPGSEAEFITEHYWGYTAQRDGGTTEYRVAHPLWAIWPAGRARLTCEASALYGTAFEAVLGAEPLSAFVAAGSAVEVFRGRRLPDSAA
jgi:uncharacterized protein